MEPLRSCDDVPSKAPPLRVLPRLPAAPPAGPGLETHVTRVLMILAAAALLGAALATSGSPVFASALSPGVSQCPMSD